MNMKFFTTAADIVSVVLVCLFPLAVGALFIRLLNMSGTPVWFFVLLGIVLAGAIAQLLWMVVFGLVRALRRKGR